MEHDAATVRTVPELARLLRLLRRREARNRDGAALTYRELAAKTGWSHAIIGEYLAGTALPPTDRFDQLIQILGATRSELGPLATARDRVEELRRPSRAASAASATRSAERVPRELPAPVPGFVGRRPQLSELNRIAASAGTETGLPIAAICGGGGVGKTALAVHWAHRRAADFPDGQLYIDLRGFSAREPVAAVDALGRFLNALGVEPDRIPSGVDERASRYRTMLAGRRMLVVLDNAVSAEHVRPLLPGSATCMVVVTSRDSLAGLVAADGAQRIQLDVLAESDGINLLRALLPDRVDAQPKEASALVHLCGGLPLALRVAAEVAASRPDEPLSEIVAELGADQDRLELLDAGDGPNTLRAVLSWSYRRLSPGAARLFRLFGVEPGPDLSLAAAASLAGVSLSTGRRLVGELTRAHMLAEVSPGRYAPHQVLRAYARELLHDEAAHDRRPAMRRLLDHYVHTADRADRVLDPTRSRIDLVEMSPGAVVGDFPTAAKAKAWFCAERQSLLAAARLGRDYGFADHAWQLAWTMATYLDRSAGWLDWAAVNTVALQATDDPAALAQAHAGLAQASARLGLFDVAEEHWQRCADQFARAGDPLGEAAVATQLADLYVRAGRSDEAVKTARRAVELYRAQGDEVGLAGALTNAGYCHAVAGDYDRALAECGEALELWRRRGHPSAAASTLDSLGFLYRRMGRYDEAERYYRQALAAHRERGDRLQEATVLRHLAEIHEQAGQETLASDERQAAASILDDFSHVDANHLRVRLSETVLRRR
ncbi:MAG: tetratricopeptide repeat protein [Micromonosporaceae bacterium]|nr:tetratricopeptide repeat protein [Micromonosporaceae bacterium]